MNRRIGINGFGRIGRDACRIILDTPHLTLAAINSNSDASSHAYLLQHDSVYGTLRQKVSADNGSVVVDGKPVACFQEKDPVSIPWEKAGVDVVLECTGKFRTKEDASGHLRKSVKHVIISAPAKDNTPTYIMGVNHKAFQKESVISNSSCTTNCISTVLSVLDKRFGVIRGHMTTIHAATDSQNLLDNSHKKDTRLRRSSLMNLIPASSGSSTDVAKLFPHLSGLLPCRAIRVPVATVSCIDLVVEVKQKTDVTLVNDAFTAASQKEMNGFLAVAQEELVSSDYVRSHFSSVIDPFETDVVNHTMVRVLAWYDNEWGYAHRLIDLASWITRS